LHAKSMTGLSPEQLDLLCDRIADQIGPWQPPRGRRRTLDLATAITMTLIWLRHNLSQALLGAFHGISQPTVSRVITSLRERIVGAIGELPGLATGQRAGQQGQGPYGGKRHKAGMNIQVISDGWGRLVDVSDPTPGSMHDARSFAVTGLAALLADRVVLADLGFVGCGVSTRSANRRVGSCRSWSGQITVPMPAPARRWSGRSRCSSSGRCWGRGIVGHWPDSRR